MMDSQRRETRTLIFSQRNQIRTLPFRCAHFEFEDVISQVDSVELLAPQIDSGMRHAFAKKIAYHTPLTLNPGVTQAPIKADYDLFFAICGDPTDMLRVDALGDWRGHCKKAVCLIDELWATEMASYDHFLRMLDRFDVVVLYYSQSVVPLSQRVKAKCVFLPPGVDAIRFCPYPDPPKRVVDFYSIGRRSELTHHALLQVSSRDGLFYLHDSIVADQVIDSVEHRSLFANIAKRSKYFMVNPGLIDRRDIRGDQIEIGNRYFEGAASGTVMVGERPETETFRQLFDWPGAMIDLPYDSTHIDAIVHDLERLPNEVETIRRTNVTQSLLRHDWVYRWESILRAVGLAPMSGLFARKERLQQLAGLISKDEIQATASSRSE
jgi:hypothetical protein